MAEQPYGEWIRSNPQLPTKEYKKEHMAQQTAVEWLYDQIEQYKLTFGDIPINVLQKYRKQAKQMEKEQIIDAYKSDRYPCSDDDAEQYYNQTYKTQNT